MASLWTTVVTALATLLGVLAGGVLTRRTQERHWLRDSRAEACAAVLREYARVEVELRAGRREERRPEPDWAAWGAALAGLSLVADDPVVAAAERLARTLVRVEEVVLGGGQDEEWGRLQRRLVEEQLGFVNAARRGLDRSQPPLTSRIGGPPDAPPPHPG